MNGPAFTADAMLGKLATWLRILGCDAEYFRDIDDGELAERVEAGRRILLTRDLLLSVRRKVRDRCLVVEGDLVEEQLRQVVRRFDLDPERHLFTRCVRCNLPLEAVSLREALDRVPPYIARTRWNFRRCPGCGRVYWRGTHRPMMERRLDGMLRGDPAHPWRLRDSRTV